METTAERDTKFHEELKGNLNSAGYPAETVPPHEQPVLSGGLELPDLVPEGVTERVHGKDIHTHVGVTSGGKLKRVVDWLRSIKQKK